MKDDGGATETVNVNVGSADVEEANENIQNLRIEIERLRAGQAEAAAGSEEFEEITAALVETLKSLTQNTSMGRLQKRENQLALSKALEASKKVHWTVAELMMLRVIKRIRKNRRSF